MTKEKAIELLDIIRSVEGDIIVDNELRDAIDVALQALSQQEQSCDTCTNDKGCVTCKDGELWEGKEQLSEDLEKEMGKYFDGWVDDPEYGQAVLPHTYECIGVSDCKDIARHFYILGLKNNIPVTQITLDELVKEGEPVSKDLEEAAKEYATTHLRNNEFPTADNAFIAGARWQKEQMEKNRLVHCDSLTKEEYDIETAFADEIIEKENRTPTFIDAIKYGMKLQKEQMMKDAVEVIMRPDDCEIWVNLLGYGYKFNDGDKAKIIIIPNKEDKE